MSEDFLPCFKFLKRAIEPRSEILSRDVLCFAGFLWADLLCIRREIWYSFGQVWRKRILLLRENGRNTWRIERFCGSIVPGLCGSIFPKTTASTVRGYKISRECIQCLYNNVIDPLAVATGQSINDRREQTLRLDTSQIALIRAPVAY